MRKIYITAVIVFCVTLSTSFTVHSQNKLNDSADFTGQEQSEQLEQLEKDYLRNVRDLLEEYTLYNSGVTMTKVIYENGGMEYTVTIHNSRLESLSRVKLGELERDLSCTKLSLEGVCIQYRFDEVS